MYLVKCYVRMRPAVHLPVSLLSLCSVIGKPGHAGWERAVVHKEIPELDNGRIRTMGRVLQAEVFFVSEAIPGCWIRKGDNTSKNPVSPTKDNAVIGKRGKYMFSL